MAEQKKKKAQLCDAVYLWHAEHEIAYLSFFNVLI